MTVDDTRRLADVIRKMSRYWEARLMDGMSAMAADAASLGIPLARRIRQHRATSRMWHRTAYRRYRAHGLSAYEAQARMHGRPVAEQRRRQILARRRYRQRWGGDPQKMGSEAWRRWMFSRCGEDRDGK